MICISDLGNGMSPIQHQAVTWTSAALSYPLLQRSWKGGILVSPCPSVRLSICPSVDGIVSALYLQQYSLDPFHICTSYQATSEGVSRVMPVSKLKNLQFFGAKFVTLTLSSFDLGSNMTQWYGLSWGGGGYPQNAGVLVVLVVKWIIGNMFQWYLTKNIDIFNWNIFENVVCKISVKRTANDMIFCNQ